MTALSLAERRRRRSSVRGIRLTTAKVEWVQHTHYASYTAPTILVLLLLVVTYLEEIRVFEIPRQSRGWENSIIELVCIIILLVLFFLLGKTVVRLDGPRNVVVVQQYRFLCLPMVMVAMPLDLLQGLRLERCAPRCGCGKPSVSSFRVHLVFRRSTRKLHRTKHEPLAQQRMVKEANDFLVEKLGRKRIRGEMFAAGKRKRRKKPRPSMGSARVAPGSAASIAGSKNARALLALAEETRPGKRCIACLAFITIPRAGSSFFFKDTFCCPKCGAVNPRSNAYDLESGTDVTDARSSVSLPPLPSTFDAVRFGPPPLLLESDELEHEASSEAGTPPPRPPVVEEGAGAGAEAGAEEGAVESKSGDSGSVEEKKGEEKKEEFKDSDLPPLLPMPLPMSLPSDLPPLLPTTADDAAPLPADGMPLTPVRAGKLPSLSPVGAGPLPPLRSPPLPGMVDKEVMARTPAAVTPS
eukprot:PLAT4794.1.p1 GENE.PLAT4794.1~~PLAT4794.1.p1  ORF type:complete len:504 (+),score=142.66 PLAT4794.1:109-1512(+)